MNETSCSASLGVLTVLKSKTKKRKCIPVHRIFRFFLSFFQLKKEMSLSHQKNPDLEIEVLKPLHSPIQEEIKWNLTSIFLRYHFKTLAPWGQMYKQLKSCLPMRSEVSNSKPGIWFGSWLSLAQKYSNKVHLLWN